MNYYIVDAFAEEVFEGNPAAVFILDQWLSDDVMQKIAIENNLSETAFTVHNGTDYDLRWFTPGGEINLCGHATLATAFTLFREIEKDSTLLTFHSMSGELTVTRKGDIYEMNFPNLMPKPIEITEQMVEVVGKRPIEAYLDRDIVLVFEDEEDIKNMSPDFDKMKELPVGKGVLVTAPSKEYDFVSRTFFPKLTINEDPVCGSAHSNFIPYWAEKLGKTEMVARQVSPRGGTLICELEGDRVRIGGKAVLYATCSLDHKF